MRLPRLLPDPTRRPQAASEDWQDTLPGELPGELPAARLRSRSQPPLTEVLQGLEARELEGQTVFDQLFGNTPAA